MKKFRLPTFFIGLFLLNPGIHGQDLLFHAYTGINISDIHGNITPGKWEFNPGPSQGFDAKLVLGDILGISAGMRITSTYYEFTPYFQVNPPIYYRDCLSCSLPPFYYPVRESKNFRSLTIPLSLEVTIPSRPAVSISAGIYYSHVYKYSFSYVNYDSPKKNDIGLRVSADFSFPVADRLDVTAGAGYFAGKKRFSGYENFRHGAVDITAGLSYRFLDSHRINRVDDDTTKRIIRAELIYIAGVNMSWNRVELNGDRYGKIAGLSAGFLYNPGTHRGASIMTGVMFERTGYSMADSSDQYYRYLVTGPASYYVDSKIKIDYLSVPVLLNISPLSSPRVSVYTGPYFAFFMNARNTGYAMNEIYGPYYYNLEKYIISDDIERIVKGFDAGWIVGGSLSLPVGKTTSASIGIHYRSGFGEVFDKDNNGDPEIPFSKDIVIRNGTISFYAAFRVPAIKQSRGK